MLNIEKYKDEIKAEIGKDKTLGCVVNKLMGNTCDDYPKCNHCYLKVFDWLLQEYKEPTLTDEEREYLSTVFKPFKEHIKYVQKEIEIYSGYDTTDGEEDEPVTNMAIYIHFLNNTFSGLPFFDENMFANMENCKDYTLEELGL